MRKSESATQEWTLASIPAGWAMEVLEVRSGFADVLTSHGVRPGSHLLIEADAPLGGPRVVRLGRSRLAVDRRLAETVLVAPLAAS